MEEVEAVVAATASLSVSTPEEQQDDISESVSPATPASQSPKPAKLKGKKAKEARKAARLERADDDGEDLGPGGRNDETVCQICKAEFPTRNKLFQHVNKTGHAALKACAYMENPVSSRFRFHLYSNSPARYVVVSSNARNVVLPTSRF